jgi:peptide/nickel transport system substrate-binding protein
MPETVVPDTVIAAGWTGELTSTNASASPTVGNTDIAAATRGGFGSIIDGEFVPDEGFGTVTIVSDDPFTVRYDLAEPAWSDGIPLDAADLVLGWAGASGLFPADDEVADDTSDAPAEITEVDEFARAIEVTFAQPDIDWQSAVTVPVPAHVVGQHALGIDDAMEAKQAVLRAVQDDDQEALAAIGGVWNGGFDVTDSDDVAADLLLSSGPFRIEDIGAGGRSVTLVPNADYRGPVTPQVARIELAAPDGDPVTAVGDALDVVQVAPTAANREPIHELERQDFTIDTSHDGTVWAVLLKTDAAFAQQPVRTAFLRAVQPTAVVAGGGGEWASAAYTGTTSMLAAPGSRAYDIVAEDSGFADALAYAGNDAAAERDAAGVGAGTPVCMLYDRGSEFATGAFAAMRDAVAETGWSLVDCGADDFDTALAQGNWNAVIARVPVPQTPADIAAQWGTGGEASVTGNADPARDELIAQLAVTTDVYEARDVLARIEASIVQASLALPLAVSPRLTIIGKDVTGIAPRTGAIAPLTAGVVQWAVVPD